MSRTLSHCAGGKKETNWVRSKLDIIKINHYLCGAGIVYSYRGEDETLGPGVGHLNLL